MDLLEEINKIRITNSGVIIKLPESMYDQINEFKNKEILEFIRSWVVVKYGNKEIKVYSTFKEKTIKKNILNLILNSKDLRMVRQNDLYGPFNFLINNIISRMSIEMNNVDFEKIRKGISNKILDSSEKSRNFSKKLSLNKIRMILLSTGTEILKEDLIKLYDECKCEEVLSK